MHGWMDGWILNIQSSSIIAINNFSKRYNSEALHIYHWSWLTLHVSFYASGITPMHFRFFSSHFGDFIDNRMYVTFIRRVHCRSRQYIKFLLGWKLLVLLSRCSSPPHFIYCQPCNCDTMGGIRFCGCGYGCQSEDPFVCFSVKSTQRTWARDFHRDRKRAMEGRSQSQEKETVGRRRQNREVGIQEKSREQTSRQKSGEVDGRERRLLEPVDSDAGLANVGRWVSIPSGFVGIPLEFTLALVLRSTECQESVTDFSLLVIWANPSPWLFVPLFLPPS